jgi:hypothetical protein
MSALNRLLGALVLLIVVGGVGGGVGGLVAQQQLTVCAQAPHACQ